MLDIIQRNPFRIVGVYATAARKEIVANITRIKANLRVNNQVSFPADLVGILSKVERTNETILKAESNLTLPKELVRYAQFWFINKTELDKVALNNLSVGSYERAISIWGKTENLSSVHNLIITHLIKEDYGKALKLASLFYGRYSSEFVQLILGQESNIISSASLGLDFLDVLCDELGASRVSPYVIDKEWSAHVRDKIITPIIDTINRSINVAKETKRKGAQVRLDAGLKLINDTLKPLRYLKGELSESNSKYQIIADKLGLAILQCGIDYYNESNDDDAPYKAIKLQRYAQSIVVGKMAKDRCEKNVRTLERIISKLPPLEVMAHHKAIQNILLTFAAQPKLINVSIKLIKDCVSHLVAIKEQLGNTHQYYLNISTSIVDKALGNIIVEVNESQNDDFYKLKDTLISAWHAQLYMDKFDLEADYKEGRYKECRKALYDIINECKGFKNSMMSFKYQYGCGWCNNLDVSDLDLRTEEEYYQSCDNLASYKSYLNKYPYGKYVKEAKSQIELLTFQEAKTSAEVESFIHQFPNSQYVPQAKKQIIKYRFEECLTISHYKKFISDFPDCDFVIKAQEELNKLIREENERKERFERESKALSACKTTNDVIAYYESEKNNKVDTSKCSLRAYELAKTEEDYHKIISTFGKWSQGGKSAEYKLKEIVRQKEYKIAKRKKNIKWTLWITIPIVILLTIYLIWGVGGFAVSSGAIAVISGLIAIGAMGDNYNIGCGKVLLLVVIAVAFGFASYGLHQCADDIEKQNNLKTLYHQIQNNPTEEICEKFIQQTDDADKADEVRGIWLSMLLNDAKSFDYDSYNVPSSYRSSSKDDNPINKLQYFINNNKRTTFIEKAQSAVDSICDSLYKVADKKSTVSGWRKYQKLVPTDYEKDAEEKIEIIENQSWATEPKAWQMALSENTISAFTKYKSLYPKGAHITLCEKKMIDLEVSNVYSGNHGTLPEMEQTGYGGGPTTYITITNSTSYILTLLYSGPDSKRLVISAGGSSSVVLKNGRYRVAASVSASNVSKYAGNENLQGGSYSVDYYISNYRY